MSAWSTAGPSVGPRGDWADGYVVDTPYFEPVTADVCPAWLSMAAVLHGQPPIDTTEPITWLDLGSGNGVSACMVAAANLNVNVWGCDVNPAHVERSRRLAARAGLDNCTFDEATFAAVADDARLGPPLADVIVLHGVYSWVSPSVQRDIARIIERRLRPGGLVFISYEAATGWASMVPLAEAMRLQTEADGRRSDLAFPDAAAAIAQLGSGGARSFPLGVHETTQLDGLAAADARYAAHEYLGQHFHPLMFDDVADAMHTARCSYVGALDATDHLSAYWVPVDLTATVIDTADVVLRELMRDLSTQRALRRDLFRRGLAVSTPVEQQAWIDTLTVVGLDTPIGEGTVAVPIGKVGLDPTLYLPLLDALHTSSLDVAGILELHRGWTPADAVSAMCLLVGGGYAAPAAREQANEETRAAARRLNEALIDENRRGADHRALVAPGIGAAVSSEYIEMLTLGAVWEGLVADVSSLTDHATAELTRQGRSVVEQGLSVDSPFEARDIVERRVIGALEKMDGVFARLGVC